MIEQLLQALHHVPGDDLAWLALADALEEASDPRAEMTRLTLSLRRNHLYDGRRRDENHLRRLLASGMVPCVPTMVVSHGIQLTLVPPGVFRMGARRGESSSHRCERPRHVVEITRPFYLGTSTITQDQYVAVMGENPSTFRPNPSSHYDVPFDSTSNFPVDSVDYGEAQAFCDALSALAAESTARRVYRLPTEAEWEYACRAGTQTIFAFGDKLRSSQANFDGNYAYGCREESAAYLHRTCPVGQYRPNAFGLYDMHGNVWEWCSDYFSTGYYSRSPSRDPVGPIGRDDAVHVMRGGSWIDAGWNCRSATRSRQEALHYVGFRIAMNVID